MAQLAFRVRKRLRVRYGVILAYLLCFGIAHVIGTLTNMPLYWSAILGGLFCAVVREAVT